VGEGATRPTVAVLLSTHNGARFLEEQLASLRSQEGVEVLLHARDDGSTDATREVLARHADRWPSLASLPAGPNLGPAASFMELLRTAPPAEYYAFCDQDDVWMAQKLARATASLAGIDGPALYCSNVNGVDEDLTDLGVPPENGDTRFEHLLFENIAYGCTTVMNRAARRLIAERAPGQGLVMHDWWCALVVASTGAVRYDPEPSIRYRQHTTNSIGATTTTSGQLLAHVRRFMGSRRGFYPIQAQAAELLRLYGDRMPGLRRQLVQRLVQSRASTAGRLKLALSRDVIRTRRLDSLAARAIIALNWH
jgi:glycosyltransferase involved in cell wall biosynthesis